MKNEVFWRNLGYVAFPELKKDIECNYLIVGGGISGVSIAYFLEKFGASGIVLIEKDGIGSGATGRAAGILTPNTELDLKDVLKMYGKRNGLIIYYSILDALNEIKRIVKEEKIGCDLEEGLSIYAESSYKNFNSIMEEYKVSKKMHFQVMLLLKNALDNVMHTKLFKYAVMSHLVASINPLKYSQNLAKRLSKKGVSIYENTIFLGMKGDVAMTPNAKIKFGNMIVATDHYKSNKTKTKVFKSTIAVTDVLTNKQLRLTGLRKGEIIWDAKKDYDYMKLTKDRRLLIGYGTKHISDDDNPLSVSRPQYKEIVSFLDRLFPKLGAKMEYVWSGSYSTTEKFLPLVTRSGNQIFILATSGLPLSTMAAKHTAKILLNRKSHLDFLYGVNAHAVRTA